MIIPKSTFIFRRRVAFADTDAMGVLHHSRYLIFFEEARVAWLRAAGLDAEHFPVSPMVLGVIETTTRHLQPCRFENLVHVATQVRQEGLRVHFQYAMYASQLTPERTQFLEAGGWLEEDLELSRQNILAYGSTVLVPLNLQLKPIRLSAELSEKIRKSSWTETWHSSL